MTPEAFILILVSALLHAGWNLIGKRTAQTVRFYAWAMAAGMVFYSPLLLSSLDAIQELPPSFWGLLFASGFCQTCYMTGLARAYTHGNLSMVYPLARALPVVIVPLLVILVYGQTQLDNAALLGIVLIVFGAIALPLKRWRDWHIKDYLTPAIGWVLVAASATAGYSILDSMAIGIMKDAGLSAFNAGSCFVVLQAGATLCWMLPTVAFLFRENLFEFPDRRWTLVAGLFVIGTYMLVLVSMSLVTEVSYVVALRQISIPIGFLIGIIWLKESLGLPKLQGFVVLLSGLLLVSL